MVWPPLLAQPAKESSCCNAAFHLAASPASAPQAADDLLSFLPTAHLPSPLSWPHSLPLQRAVLATHIYCPGSLHHARRPGAARALLIHAAGPHSECTQLHRWGSVGFLSSAV